MGSGPIAGGRAGRIGHAREQLLAADFDFNDAHRRNGYHNSLAGWVPNSRRRPDEFSVLMQRLLSKPEVRF